MKFVLLILLLLTTSVKADDLPVFESTVKIEIFAPEMRNFSGGVIRCDDEIHVLTCWHGLMGFTKPKSASVTFVNGPAAYSTELRVEKFDMSRDVLLLRGLNIHRIKSKVLKIALKNPEPNSECTSWGYGLSRKLVSRKTKVANYDKRTFDTNYVILSTTDPMVQGMSGGPLIQGEMLYGILSSSSNTSASYCPAEQLTEFINK